MQIVVTLSILISLIAIFLMMGSSSDSTNFLIATICPVSLFLHLKTTPYEPSPIFPILSYFSIPIQSQGARDDRRQEHPLQLEKQRRRFGTERENRESESNLTTQCFCSIKAHLQKRIGFTFMTTVVLLHHRQGDVQKQN